MKALACDKLKKKPFKLHCKLLASYRRRKRKELVEKNIIDVIQSHV